MYQRQPHTHLTCGFCLQPKIIRSKPHETKSVHYVNNTSSDRMIINAA